jgi:hypothetical protein
MLPVFEKTYYIEHTTQNVGSLYILSQKGKGLLNMPRSLTERVEVQLYSFLTSALDGGG